MQTAESLMDKISWIVKRCFCIRRKTASEQVVFAKNASELSQKLIQKLIPEALCVTWIGSRTQNPKILKQFSHLMSKKSYCDLIVCNPDSKYEKKVVFVTREIYYQLQYLVFQSEYISHEMQKHDFLTLLSFHKKICRLEIWLKKTIRGKTERFLKERW